MDFIENQVLRAREEMETGGLLLGTIGPGTERVVLAATPPGPSALHHPVMFERDLRFSQFLLDNMHHQHKLEYLGEWHKHPRNFTEPSSGDEIGCRAILSDPAYKIDGLLLFPIFTVTDDSKVKRHCYCMDTSLRYCIFSPTVEERAHFMDSIHSWEQQYIAGATSNISTISITAATEPSRAQDEGADAPLTEPHWYEVGRGKEELASIMALTTKGLNLSARILPDKRIAIAVNGPGHQEVTVICDKSHPQTPPIVHITSAHFWHSNLELAQFISDIHLFFSRDSSSRLDVADEQI
ncbi:MAG: Mov34/MPN/PAD-1 family protein [Acidobacteriia bacterium]|nr:Mov34/MPN/PAD-1 family protein [Terriglobia bacterium]